ncbi:MAG: hypothetical protein WCS69_04600 [Ignavibacteriaceae bacterium]|jgi:hypothetical protein
MIKENEWMNVFHSIMHPFNLSAAKPTTKTLVNFFNCFLGEMKYSFPKGMYILVEFKVTKI